MFALSFCVFAGVLFMMVKLPHRLLLRMLKYDALIDLAVSALVLFQGLAMRAKRLGLSGAFQLMSCVPASASCQNCF